MNGQIGVLIQDKQQVAGFSNWNMDVLLEGSKSQGGPMNYQLRQIKLRSEELWITREPQGLEMIVKLYQYINGCLVLVFQKAGQVILPSLPIGTKKHQPLEVIWTS